MMRQFLISIFLFLYFSTSYANGLVPNDTIWKKKKNGERFYVIYNGEVDPPPRRKAVPCFEIGLNTFTGDVPDAYTLRTISARYVGVGLHERFRVGGEESWWALQIGIEGTWNNFRFDADEYIVATDEGNAFVENGFELSRNKLTSVQIGVPLMAHYQFRKDNESTWQVGLGGYASYVVSSYAKIRF
ncbi:MAG: outer membrane beta-barrel protein, partial [Bacteroidota bacterium]